jgi:hypothetical protein
VPLDLAEVGDRLGYTAAMATGRRPPDREGSEDRHDQDPIDSEWQNLRPPPVVLPPAVPPSEEQIRAALSNPEVGREVRASMEAIRVVALRLAANLGHRTHLLPALDLIAYTSHLAQYITVATSTGRVTEFEPGRDLGEARAILGTVKPDDDIARPLRDAAQVVEGHVTRRGAFTTVHGDLIVRGVIALVESAGRRYRGARETVVRDRIVARVRRDIWELAGTLPEAFFVAEALEAAPRGRGRPPRGEVVQRSKDVVYADLLMSIGYDVANPRDYMP